MDNKEYKEYTAADFLNDPDFLLWCLDPDKREDLFWSEFPANHPETFAEFRKAIQTVGSIRLNNFTLEEGEKAELYDSIMSDYRALCSRRRLLRRRLFALAAAAVVAAGVVVPALLGVFRPPTETDVSPARASEIRLISGRQSEHIASESASIECAPSGEVRINGRKIASAKPARMNRLVVPEGKRADITLSDGSRVWINSGSVFTFPAAFGEGERRVSIEGELYIDVTPDPEHPFIVHNALFDTRVLGTSFDVNAYCDSNRPASVVLVHGAVEITTGDGEQVQLESNDMFSLKAGNYTVVKVDPSQYVSWKDGLFTFSSGTLERVIAQIAAYYRVEIVCDPDVRELCCSGKLVLFDDLSDTLDVLSDILPINCRIEQRPDGTRAGCVTARTN